MPRSVWKGPFIHPSIMKKLSRHSLDVEAGRVDPDKPLIIRTWSRSSTITPRMVGVIFDIHKGNGFVRLQVSSDHVGTKLGEYAPTRKFVKHSNAKVASRVPVKKKES